MLSYATFWPYVHSKAEIVIVSMHMQCGAGAGGIGIRWEGRLINK